MQLSAEIERIFRRVDQKVINRDIAHEAVRHLILLHLPANPPRASLLMKIDALFDLQTISRSPVVRLAQGVASLLEHYVDYLQPPVEA